MPVRTFEGQDEASMAHTLAHIKHIFNEAQDSVDNHQKNCTHLHKVHKEAATYVQTIKRAGRGRDVEKPVGEHMFSETFLDMILRGLPMKKGVRQVDNVAKFVGAYIKYANVKALEEQDEDGEDTRASRFTTRLLQKLLEGFTAKDKNVRYRVLQLITEMVAHLGELDVADYVALHSALRARVYDKDPHVRVQAIIALSRLVESEDPDEVPEGEWSGLEMIIQALRYDPSAEVRRAALLNIPVDNDTLPDVLDRMRDIDITTRKMVFANVLSTNITIRTDDGTSTYGPTHPKAMPIKFREIIVRDGLGDRHSSVSTVAAKLMSHWLDAVTPLPPVQVKADGEAPLETPKKEDTQENTGVNLLREGLLNVLGLFDLGEETVAKDALISIFEIRPEILSSLDFSNDEYWEAPTSESVFLARVFVDFCKREKDFARLENTLPVVTSLAFRLQSAYNSLQSSMSEDADEAVVIDLTDEEQASKEDEQSEKELIIVEMLKLAEQMDYADEIGRRKMFALVRQMMVQRALPTNLLSPCLDLLRVLSSGESDLIRLVTETINDLRYAPDHEEEEPPLPSSDDVGATPATVKPPRMMLFNNPRDLIAQDKAEADEIDARCLLLCIGMLERVNGTLENHSTLDGVLKDLIIPSVKRSDLTFREMGLTALGLCCLISPKLARDSFPIFAKQFKGNNPTRLKIRLILLIFDIVMTNEVDFLGTDEARATNQEILLSGLREVGTGRPAVGPGVEKEENMLQAAICKGLAKLMLAGMITDIEVLAKLLLHYLSPDTANNQELRQCLAFFFPVYSYSSSENQRNIQRLFYGTFLKFNAHRQEMGDDDEMVSAAQMLNMLVDLTDPREIYGVPGQIVDEDVHIDLSIHLMESLLMDKRLSKADHKVICQCLQRFHLPEEVDLVKLLRMRTLLHALTTRQPFRDTTTKNAIGKFETIVCKKYEKGLIPFNEEEYRKHESLQDLFEYLDDMIPMGEEEFDLDVKPPKGKKRRSTSIISASTESEVTSGATSKSKGRAKKPRISRSDADSDEDDIREITPPPRRSRPQRAAASKPKVPPEVIYVSSDSDEGTTPIPRRHISPSIGVKEENSETDINDVLVDYLGGTAPGNDSIMDGDSEEEEDEVQDLVQVEDDDD